VYFYVGLGIEDITMACYSYNYTVSGLLHDAKDIDDITNAVLIWRTASVKTTIELRLVVAALNQLPEGTYTTDGREGWSTSSTRNIKILSVYSTPNIMRRLERWTNGLPGGNSQTRRWSGSMRSERHGLNRNSTCVVFDNLKMRLITFLA